MSSGPAYIHGALPEEQERLEAQNRLLGGASFLPALSPGMAVLEVGCGTGAIAREVAAKVLPGGRVIGVDVSADQVKAARLRAAQDGIGNIEFREGQAQALDFPSGSFDLVYSRFLLEHVAEPLKALREMARTLKPGGTIVSCECSVGCCSNTQPPLPNAQKALNALYQLQKLRGGDPYIGEKLETLFREAALTGIEAETLSSHFDTPEQLGQYCSGGAQMVRAAEADMLKEGLIGRQALDEAYREWANFAKQANATASYKVRRVMGSKSAG
jgi:ubiquinone/menaquinone biosynthesis C-methylase UbiE